MNSIKIPRGDSRTLNVKFTNSDGTDFDITGYTVMFTAKRECDLDDTDDDNAIIQKNVTSHSSPTTGETTISLTSTNTNQDAGVYYWDLQLVSGTIVLSTSRGQIEIINDITKRTS